MTIPLLITPTTQKVHAKEEPKLHKEHAIINTTLEPPKNPQKGRRNHQTNTAARKLVKPIKKHLTHQEPYSS